MRKGLAVWRRLGGIEKIFLCLLVCYSILAVNGRAPFAQAMVALAVGVFGIVAVIRFARRSIGKAIWRLRNRLIAAYVLIAVVPVVLILSLVVFTVNRVIGQMAVYLVNTELKNREEALARQAIGLARIPMGADPERGLNRFAYMARELFPSVELRATGGRDLVFPADATVQHPPAVWDERPRERLAVIKEGGSQRLVACAHVHLNGEEVTVAAPVTHELLARLVPGLGDVAFVPVMDYPKQSQVPPPKNAFDYKITGYMPVSAHQWEAPDTEQELFLVVETRISAVLGKVFQGGQWADLAFTLFVAVSALFLALELASLYAGIRLSRTITGAVHELYEGTQRVKEADFSYRIPVKGNDQLAELTQSFNTMTENLGKLIVVAKEKERLESELAIAREVQNQLFPKDVPFTRTLELKGVCNPARMVSGDYYDFMALSDSSLAFAIGDVAGKGISAALLMATIQSTMRTQLSGTNGAGPASLSTAKLVANLNRQLYATTAPEKYATFYFALYDDSTHALTYTNAGHLAPILLRGNTLSTLDSTGTVVGAFPIARYTEKTIEMQRGDTLVAYTDGIVEPENAYGEMFGEDRLKELLVKYSRADSSEIIARTMEAVNQWTGAGELQDDMTMLVARRL